MIISIIKKHELFFLGLIVFLSRLPFLFAGYGHEEDSWGIAAAAHNTFLTGIYEISRRPGHPVQELILSALWGTGPFVYNLFSAFFSIAAAIYFSKSLKALSFRYYWLAALAFSFVPVVYIAGTYTADYIWTEAFVMLSFFNLLKKRVLYSGIFLGLAIGCRITSGVMLIPFALMLFENESIKKFYQNILKLSLVSLTVGAICFLPVVQVEGWDFFMYYDQFPYPPLSKVFYKGTIGVWGLTGFASIGLGIFFILKNKNRFRGTLFSVPVQGKYLTASLVMIVLFVISYFRLPQKSAYLLPVVPFVIFLILPFLDKKQFFIFSVLLILSPFVCSINLTDKFRGAEFSPLSVKATISGQEIFFDLLTGPVFSDYSKRKQKMKYTDRVMEKAKSLRGRNIIIAGWWYNEITVKCHERLLSDNFIYEDYIDEKEINFYLKHGFKIYYLPEQDTYNDLLFGMRGVTPRSATLLEIEK